MVHGIFTCHYKSWIVCLFLWIKGGQRNIVFDMTDKSDKRSYSIYDKSTEIEDAS